jgi:hypothetical protein
MEKGLDLLSVLFPTEPQTIYIQILVERVVICVLKARRLCSVLHTYEITTALFSDIEAQVRPTLNLKVIISYQKIHLDFFYLKIHSRISHLISIQQNIAFKRLHKSANDTIGEIF